jgi:hypothetical protein
METKKCGDCFHADVCEESDTLVGFSRENPAYCGMFLDNSDVVEVVHGRWIWKNGKCFCSACSKLGESKQVYQDGTVDEYPYCPNCGAKMDAEGF